MRNENGGDGRFGKRSKLESVSQLNFYENIIMFYIKSYKLVCPH